MRTNVNPENPDLAARGASRLSGCSLDKVNYVLRHRTAQPTYCFTVTVSSCTFAVRSLLLRSGRYGPQKGMFRSEVYRRHKPSSFRRHEKRRESLSGLQRILSKFQIPYSIKNMNITKTQNALRNQIKIK